MALLEGRYIDYGVVVGIEGSDPSHAVAVLDFAGLATFGEHPVAYVAAKEFPDGGASIVLGSVVRAEVNGKATGPLDLEPKIIEQFNLDDDELFMES